jgi:hypothetical protein
MALRTKTIEYAFNFSTATRTSAATTSFTQIAALAIPETTSRTFRSVILQFFAPDAEDTATSTSTIVMSITLGGSGASSATISGQTLVNSGENYSMMFWRDVTSYFQSSFTGTSHTCDASIAITGPQTINHSAKLIITYEYDDSAETTRIKTVRIPIDGNNGALTTALTTVGQASQIPALDTFLPEASKTYRDIFFEVWSHTGTTAATAATMTMRYNGATSLTSGQFSNSTGNTNTPSLNTDRSIIRIDKLLGTLGTAGANTVEASVTSTTGCPFNCLGGVLVVTYEYDHDASTTILNSLQIPIIDEAGFMGGPTSADRSRFRASYFIQEPETITLVQSGVLFSCIDAGALTYIFNAGAQTDRTFTHPATARAGCVFHTRRVDSGALGGAGVTLARGLNEFTFEYYATSGTTGNIGSNASGILYLNYYSGKHADGDGAHAHTTSWIHTGYMASTLLQRYQYTPNTVPIINETNYWITSTGFEIVLITSGTASGSLGISLQAEIQSGESQGAGWRDLYTSIYASDAEMGTSVIWGRARPDFKRYPNDMDSERLSLETSRAFRFDCSLTSVGQVRQLVTWHSITYTLSGTVTGSDAGTVTIDMYRSDTLEKLDSTSRTGDGSFSFTWYDDTIPLYLIAYDSTNKVITDSQLVGVAFSVDLSGGGGGGPTYYSYV